MAVRKKYTFLFGIFLSFFISCASGGGGPSVTSSVNPPITPKYPIEGSLNFGGVYGDTIDIRAASGGWLEISLHINDWVILRPGDTLEIWEDRASFYLIPSLGMATEDFVVRVTTDGEAQLEGYFDIKDATMDFTYLLAPHRLGYIKVISGNVVRGDRISILLSDAYNPGFRLIAIPVSSSGHTLSFKYFKNDSGEPDELVNPITINIVGGKVSYLRLIAPSTIQVGESFSMVLRVEDKYGNKVASYDGTIRFSAQGVQGLPASYTFTTSDGGLKEFSGLVIASAGVYRIKAFDDYLSISGRSNPIQVFSSPSTRRIYWGDLHCHSYDGYEIGVLADISDPRRIYEQARDEQRLDFLAITPHVFTQHPELPGEWFPLVREGAQINYMPGKFITFIGYEWRGEGGDHNIIFPGDVTEIPEPENPDIFAMYDRAASAGALVIPHVGGATADLSYHDERVQKLVEISSVHRHSEWFGHQSLNFLNKTGFIGSSDNHIGTCGGRHPILPALRPYSPDMKYKNSTSYGGLTAVYATGLTRGEVHQALMNRRTYATSGARILLDFTVNGSSMGSEISVSNAPVLNVKVNGSNDIELVEIIRNDKTIYAVDGDGADLQFTYTDYDAPNGENYYYVRVTQIDDELAWSSPIWVSQSGMPFHKFSLFEEDWNYDRLEIIDPEKIIEAEQYGDELRDILRDIGSESFLFTLMAQEVVKSPEGEYVVYKAFDPLRLLFVRIEYFVDRPYTSIRIFPGTLHYGQYE